MTEIITMPGGMRLAYQNIPYIHSVSFGVFVKIGSRNEIAADNGIAHFTEHMLFKGTEKRSAFDIVREMDMLGANMNAFTSKELTAFYFQCIDDTVEPCAEILSDLILHSVFPVEETEKEKGVVLEEIGMVLDTPDDLSQDLCSAAFWGSHPLGLTILGSAENVKSFSQGDLRSFVSKHYVQRNVVVSVCGNISKERAIALVQKYFVFPDRPLDKRVFSLPEEVGGRVNAVYKDIEQANLTLAFPSLSQLDARIPAQAVMSVALGGGMSSLLFQEIREKLGLVYSVYDYSSAYEDVGAHSIYLGTNPKNLKDAVLALKRCLKEFVEKGLDEETLRLAKQQVKSSLIMSSESSMTIMRAQARSLLYQNEPYSVEEKIARISEVSRADVNALIPEIFNSKKIGVGYVGKQTKFDLTEIYQ